MRLRKALTMKKLTFPNWYYSPLVCMDYSGLNKDDIKILNNDLLDNGVLFSDCVKTSEEYIKLISGMPCMMQDFYFA